MEFIADVASIFHIEFYQNREIRIAESKSICYSISQWSYWNRGLRGLMAVVSRFNMSADSLIYCS